MLSSADFEAAKPDPAIFMEACRKLGTTPARTLHAGDTFVDDIEGAKAAGFRAVLIERSAQSTEIAVERISNLEEILPLL